MDVRDYYNMVSDLITFERFKMEIEERKVKYGNLLDEEAIAYLIVDEMGRNPGNKMKISELYDGINATLSVKVEKIGEIENVKDRYRILRILISDETGKCYLVLWNEEIDEAIDKLKEGMSIKIINGYVRENIYGLQVSLGKWGMLMFE